MTLAVQAEPIYTRTCSFCGATYRKRDQGSYRKNEWLDCPRCERRGPSTFAAVIVPLLSKR